MLFFAVFAAFAFIGCGKKGAPLPPLVKLPVAPENFVAERRGNLVDLRFTVPGTNTDGSRPANANRADVYAITVPTTPVPLTDAQLLKLATKIGSVRVKAPRDPNLTAGADEPSDDVEAPEGPGLDQGAAAHLEEELTAEMLKPVAVPKDPKGGSATRHEDALPLLAPPAAVPTRTYVADATSTRGRKGPLSPRIVVPLVPPPPPPSTPTIAYDETKVTVTWPAVAAGPVAEAPAAGGAEAVLPSTPLGGERSAIGYYVYDATNPAPVRLTKTPIEELQFVDTRIVWGEKRCYTVRTAETIGAFTIESDAPPAQCETLVDTFAPAAPKGVAGIPSEGAINLIWEPNAEKDLAGYIVLRAAAPQEPVEPVTPAPIQETSFKDTVQRGVQYVYTVKAVDRAGNASPPSERIIETAR